MASTCATIATLHSLSALVSWLTVIQSPVDVAYPRSDEVYDFIIVGGGSAGCVLANRLSENEAWNVLLLEAGGEEPRVADVPGFGSIFQGSHIDWKYKVQYEAANISCGGPCVWPRGKTLGGSSAINGMIYVRGSPHDFDHWAELGNTGWSYKEVLPYFKKSENNLDASFARDKTHHARGGYLGVGHFPYKDKNIEPIKNGYKELGYKEVDINANFVPGVLTVQATQKNGVRQSTNRAFLEPVRNRNNLVVRTGVRATRILIHEGNKTAYGVEYMSEEHRNQTMKAYAAKEVVVSAGTISSPQLLMLSGIGPKETLDKFKIKVVENLDVGENLHDHVVAQGVHYKLHNTCPVDRSGFISDGSSYEQFHKTGPWSATGSNQVVSFSTTKYDTIPDIENHFVPFQDSTGYLGWCYYNKIVMFLALLRPKSRGYITLNGTDPFAQPLIFPNTFAGDDLDVLLEAIKAAVKLNSTEAFMRSGITLDTTPLLGCENLTYGSDDYWRCTARSYFQTIFHPVGTCKMGPKNDTEAVVSPQLQVYGVERLRVCDASVMPYVTSGNINAPTIMIAEKCSDFIKDSWK